MTSMIFAFLFSDLTPGFGDSLNKEMALISFIFLFGSAFISFLLKENTSLSGVKAGMLVTLILNLIIPSHLGVLITAGFTGSFMATTASNRVKNLFFLFLVVIFSYFIFVPAYPLQTGTSGKLGVITLIGYMAAEGAFGLFGYLRAK